MGGVSEIADPHLDRLVNTGDVAGLAAGILEQLHRAPETVKRQFQPTSWEESAELLRNEIRACLGIGEEVNDTPRELVGVSL